MVTITAGDSFNYVYSNSNYPADTWTAHMSIVAAGVRYDVTSSGNGADHTFSALPADTALYLPGTYTYYITMTDGADRITVESSQLTILPNPQVGTHDSRSFAAQMLALIEATLLGEATNEQLHILQTRHGITDIQQDIEKLQALRNEYRAEADRDKAKDDITNGKANPYKIQGRYIRP